MDNINHRVDIPLVDILLPIFNGEKYLPDLLSSISCQSYKNFHLIIRDDVSLDGSVRLLKDYGGLLSNKVSIFVNEDNVGVVRNINFLLESSVAPYIMFADQDDFWLKNKISKSLKEIQKIEGELGVDTPIVVFSDAYVGDDALVKQKRSLVECNGYFEYNPSCEINLFKNLMVQNIASGCTMIINETLKKRLMSIPKEAIMHDWWIMLVASAMGKVVFLSEKTMVYRLHRGNTLGLRRASFFMSVIDIVLSPKRAKSRVVATYIQAGAFQRIYADFINDDVKALLFEYSSLSRYNFFRRCQVLWKNKFKKSSVGKTIGFYLFS